MQQTYTQRLALVREAIDKIMGGAQSWRMGERQYTRADLGALERMERRYERLAAQEAQSTTGRGRNRVRYIGF